MSDQPADDTTSAAPTQAKPTTALNPVAAPFHPKVPHPTPAPTTTPKPAKSNNNSKGSKVFYPPLPTMMPFFGLPPVPMPMIPMPTSPPAPISKPRPVLILVLGDAGSGKTFLSEKVANELKLLCFCGANELEKFSNQGKTEWEKRALVISSIESMIKSVFIPGSPYRGVIIDRQGKSVDDIYYLNAMLRRNAWNLNAVLFCTVGNDQILVERIRTGHSTSEDHIIMERIRAARFLVERCREVYSSPGLCKSIDTSGKEDVTLALFKKEVSGLLSSASMMPLKLTNYPKPCPPPSESRFLTFVEDSAEYSDVIVKILRLLQKDRLTKYPGTTSSTLLNATTAAQMKASLDPEKALYVFRQYRKGTAYLLYQTKNGKVYLLPRHMRCVYSLDFPLWKKYNMKEFLLDGEFECDVNGSDVFYVYDCLAVQGKACLNRSWAERQKYITDCMIPLEDEFTPLPGRVTIVRQVFVNALGVKELVNRPQTTGIVMQHQGMYHLGSDPRLMTWFPPTAIRVDLRVRHVDIVKGADEGVIAVQRVQLDALNYKDGARYDDAQVTIDIQDYPVVGYGSIVEVSVDVTGPKPVWKTERVRSDRPMADSLVRIQSVLSEPPLTIEGFLEFVNTVYNSQSPDAKKTTFQGADVVRQMLDAKHATTLSASAAVPCKYYLKGRCRNGSLCPFTHPEDTPSGAVLATDLENGNVAPCDRCHVVAAGEVDHEGDGYFYCYDCWDAYEEEGARQQQGSNKKSRRRRKR
eukprot:PhF_6_TR13650/c0_g1_i1/m.21894